jgi:Dehydratase family
MPIRINVAIGGSTNAVIHLLAVAGRIGVPLSLDDWDRLGREVPTIVDLMPSGRFGILSIRAGYVHQGGHLCLYRARLGALVRHQRYLDVPYLAGVLASHAYAEEFAATG